MKRWPLFLIALPAAVAVWSGWVGLGGMTGFGIIHPLPGIADGFTINSAITLPIGVEAYASYALAAWLSDFNIAKRAKRFARNSSIASLALGMLGQVAYHLLNAAHAVHAPWPVTVGVSCLPVITLGFGVGLAHLIREPQSHADEVTAVASGISSISERTPSRSAETSEDETPVRWNVNHMRAKAQLEENPDLTGAQFAEMINTSDRHARRILREVRKSA